MIGLIVAAVGGAFHQDDVAVRTAASAQLHVNRFGGRRAFAELRRQVDLGPRPAGSAASRRLAARLRRALPHGRYEAVPGGLRNVVGSLPGTSPAGGGAGHYDTKAIPRLRGAHARPRGPA